MNRREIILDDGEGHLREDAFWLVLAHSVYPNCQASVEQAAFLLQHEHRRFLELGDKHKPSKLVAPILAALSKQAGQMTLCGMTTLALLYRRSANPRIGLQGAVEAVAALRPEQGHFLATRFFPDGTKKQIPVSSDPAKIKRAFNRYRATAHIQAARLVAAEYLSPRYVWDFIPEADLCVVRTAAALQVKLLQMPVFRDEGLLTIVGAAPGELMDDYPMLEPSWEMAVTLYQAMIHSVRVGHFMWPNYESYPALTDCYAAQPFGVHSMADTFLSDAQIAARYSVHRVSVWRWAKSDPTFPKSYSLSPGCTRWKLSEIEAWEAQRANPVAA